MKVGMVGLGAMGLGMARNLAKADLLAGVYNRTNAKTTEFNVAVYDSPEAMAVAVDIVLICVSADQDVIGLVEARAKTIKPGSIVVDLSTVSSETAKNAAAMLLNKEVDFLDAPVSGGVEGAKNGTLAMMVGGSTKALEKVRPVIEVIAKRIIHMGETGSGQATKAVNQIMCAGINQAVTEALAFGQAQGLEMEKVIDVISGGAAGNWFLDHRGSTMTRSTFAPGFMLALHHKDLKICQTMASKANVAIPLSDMTVIDYEQLMRDGYGDEDISALYRLKRS